MAQNRTGQTKHFWYDANTDWRRAKLITAGIDLGASSSKTVIMVDGAVFACSNFRNTRGRPNSASEVLEMTIGTVGMILSDIEQVIVTGCGIGSTPGIGKTMSEISCHVRGVNYYTPSVSSALIMGAENCFAVKCDDANHIIKFLANSFVPAYCRRNTCLCCGTAQGKNIEAIADFLNIPIQEVGQLSLNVDDENLQERLTLEPKEPEVSLESNRIPIYALLNSACNILARSQAAGLLGSGWSKAEVLAAYCSGVAHQAALLVRRLGVTDQLIITGGVAKNIGVVSRIEKELNVEAIVPAPDPQISGALGAAIFGADLLGAKFKTSPSREKM